MTCDFVLEVGPVFSMVTTQLGEVTAVHWANIFIGVAEFALIGGSNIVLTTRNDRAKKS